VNKLITLALLALGSTYAAAHGDAMHATAKKPYVSATVEKHAFGHEGNPKRVNRVIRIEMSDAFRFTPAEITVKRGETVRFTVRNGAQQLHEMVLGTTKELNEHAELMKKFPEMEHADAHMAHVAPGASGDIVWQFTQRGEYPFACLIPGHYEAGMVGKVVVR
jgi:uncharacterized cupredoxin-like copper-binding protein